MGSFGDLIPLWQEDGFRIIEDTGTGRRWVEHNVIVNGWDVTTHIHEGDRNRWGKWVPEKIITKALDYGIVLG